MMINAAQHRPGRAFLWPARAHLWGATERIKRMKYVRLEWWAARAAYRSATACVAAGFRPINQVGDFFLSSRPSAARRCFLGYGKVAPRDLRRTCGVLRHDAGGELDQIQFLLGHVSVQTTERNLGCKQRIRNAVNRRIEILPKRRLVSDS
jgi:integrase